LKTQYGWLTSICCVPLMFFDDMNMNIMSVYNMKLNNNYN